MDSVRHGVSGETETFPRAAIGDRPFGRIREAAGRLGDVFSVLGGTKEAPEPPVLGRRYEERDGAAFTLEGHRLAGHLDLLQGEIYLRPRIIRGETDHRGLPPEAAHGDSHNIQPACRLVKSRKGAGT